MIRFEPDFPDDLRSSVAPLIEQWRSMIPTWCQEVVLRYDPQQEARMAARINYRNRWAVLIVTGQWFDQPEDERVASLLHELMHICMEPFTVAASRVIEDLTDEGTPLRELAHTMYEDGMEAAVEDLARCVLRTCGAPA